MWRMWRKNKKKRNEKKDIQNDPQGSQPLGLLLPQEKKKWEKEKKKMRKKINIEKASNQPRKQSEVSALVENQLNDNGQFKFSQIDVDASKREAQARRYVDVMHEQMANMENPNRGRSGRENYLADNYRNRSNDAKMDEETEKALANELRQEMLRQFGSVTADDEQLIKETVQRIQKEKAEKLKATGDVDAKDSGDEVLADFKDDAGIQVLKDIPKGSAYSTDPDAAHRFVANLGSKDLLYLKKAIEEQEAERKKRLMEEAISTWSGQQDNNDQEQPWNTLSIK